MISSRKYLIFPLLSALILAFALAGCDSLFTGPKSRPARPGTVETPQRDPLDEARQALAKGQYAQAEALSQRLAARTDVSPQVLGEALRILAESAAQNQHPNVSLTALDRIRGLQPGADASREWLDTWFKAMSLLSERDAAARAQAIVDDTSRGPAIRGCAQIFKSLALWKSFKLESTLPELEIVYGQMPSADAKIIMEQRLALELSELPGSALDMLAREVYPDNQNRYPFSIILVTSLHKAASSDLAAKERLSALAGQIVLADPGLFSALPTRGAAAAITPITATPVSGRPVVLVLPMSGQFGATAGKIALGAEIACNELTRGGSTTTLVVIDTEQPDWLARVAGLPKNSPVIGGPVRMDDYAALKQQGLTASKTFMTFLPRLGPGEEGSTAWRFYYSSKDQADALLRFTSSIGISSYAVLYPDEGYGRAMLDIFVEQAKSYGAYSIPSSSYNPADSISWMKTVGDFTKSGSFQAVFLPDSWKNMDIIVPNLFYYGSTNQVLMGTSLWEQGLKVPGAFASPQYYGRAIFPGAWNAAGLSAYGVRLNEALLARGQAEADFWVGLGYDFARMAAVLNIPDGWTPATVNSVLSQNAFASWSMAPIFWNASGQASQQLYIFKPTAEGFIPVTPETFRSGN